jgi:hypothetical protein
LFEIRPRRDGAAGFFSARHACVPSCASREILRFAQDDTKMRYGNQIGRGSSEPFATRESLRNLRAPSEQKQNPESRAKERALNKVPHLRSSPFGRRHRASYAKVSYQGEANICIAQNDGKREWTMNSVGGDARFQKPEPASLKLSAGQKPFSAARVARSVRMTDEARAAPL